MISVIVGITICIASTVIIFVFLTPSEHTPQLVVETQTSVQDTAPAPQVTKNPNGVFDVVQRGTVKEISRMIDDGVNFNVRTKDKVTPLMLAAQKNSSPEVIELLVKIGANVKDRDVNGRTALMYAAESNKSIDVLETLISLGSDVDARDYDKKKAVHLAEKNSLAVVDALLAAAELPRFNTIFDAARYGRPRDIELAIKVGWNVDARYDGDDVESWGRAIVTALNMGADAADLVGGLIPGAKAAATIAKGAVLALSLIDTDDKEHVRWTPLMFAAQYNNSTVVRALIRNGANVNLQAKDGVSALTIAGKRGAEAIISELDRAKAH